MKLLIVSAVLSLSAGVVILPVLLSGIVVLPVILLSGVCILTAVGLTAGIVICPVLMLISAVAVIVLPVVCRLRLQVFQLAGTDQIEDRQYQIEDAPDADAGRKTGIAKGGFTHQSAKEDDLQDYADKGQNDDAPAECGTNAGLFFPKPVEDTEDAGNQFQNSCQQ